MIFKSVGNVQLMQKINRIKVLDYIRRKGAVPRPEIASVTGLSPSSITNIVTHLLEKRLVYELGTVESKEVGRKATLIKFNADAAAIVAVNIEAAAVNTALTNLEGEIIRQSSLQLEKSIKENEISGIVKNEISKLLKETEATAGINAAGIGIAVSGIVEDEKLVFSSSLKWKGLSLKQTLENSFHLPVYIQNNSRTKAMSVLRSTKDELEQNIIFLDLTLGVGVINIYDQKINEAVIGEFGHTTVNKDGPLCFCGNHGCLEVECSVDTVINRAQQMLDNGRCKILSEALSSRKEELNYDLILEACDNGDTDVREILRECGVYLGIGIANLINIFNPQKIIINGDILLKSNLIYETAVIEAKKRAYERFTRQLKYERVCIDMQQALKGVSYYITDRLFDITGLGL